ncbi:MAG: YXWGXW repeat-containing protein [Terracidiphilus sp.]
MIRHFRSARWVLLALLILAIPASSFAGVFISVGIAPPVLPVYVQPICPEPGLMWTPGYWAYGADGYYWVPGAWVPAPAPGLLWTPGYWGWGGGRYIFHDGYWGPHVGFYGGVNYGFGYGGIGFAGGVWRGGFFAYNTAVMHVGVGGVWGSRVYVDHAVVERGFVARDSHVAFSGGPGGIRHDPSPEERMAEHDQHRAPSDVQQHHAEAARMDRTSYAKNNGGHPANAAMAHPMGASHTETSHSTTTTRTTESRTVTSTHTNTAASAHAGGAPASHAMTASHPASTPHPASAPRSAPSGGAPKSSPGGHKK